MKSKERMNNWGKGKDAVEPILCSQSFSLLLTEWYVPALVSSSSFIHNFFFNNGVFLLASKNFYYPKKILNPTSPPTPPLSLILCLPWKQNLAKKLLVLNALQFFSSHSFLILLYSEIGVGEIECGTLVRHFTWCLSHYPWGKVWNKWAISLLFTVK